MADEFQLLADKVRNEPPSYILAEMNDLLTKASASEIESITAPSIVLKNSNDIAAVHRNPISPHSFSHARAI